MPDRPDTRESHIPGAEPRRGDSILTAESFWAKVEKTGDCWIWTGRISDGYGYFTEGRSNIRAHRRAYEELVGPIPAGMTLDHLCRVRHCVNPHHLEPVTHRDKQRRRYYRLRGRTVPGV